MITIDQTTRSPAFVIAALYRFTALPDFADYRDDLTRLCNETGTTGTLLLAHEGINGTIASTREGIDRVLAFLRTLPGCADLEVKESWADENPFLRLKVRLKREIVTMGVEGIDPSTSAGTYVAPEDWNDLIAQPDVLLIDTRNDYEVKIGTFAGAVDPDIETFRDFPAWIDQAMHGENRSKVAMFCTGGIRCEKSTAYLKSQGFDEVYHLKGGILKYLEEVSPDDSKWQGECFVFDRRVSVGHGLEPGPYQLCVICREPFLSGEGAGGYARSECPQCQVSASEEQKHRARARQTRIDDARAKGKSHLGPRES